MNSPYFIVPSIMYPFYDQNDLSLSTFDLYRSGES
jgi:hypothetical protein